MNKYKLRKAGINARAGIERLSGNEEKYETYLYEFTEDEYFDKLKADIQNKDIENGFKDAHALKGIVGNLSMDNLFNAVNPLVEELRSGSFEHAEELFVQVEKSYQEVIEVLKE